MEMKYQNSNNYTIIQELFFIEALFNGFSKGFTLKTVMPWMTLPAGTVLQKPLKTAFIRNALNIFIDSF